jgi:hypothetical protein
MNRGIPQRDRPPAESGLFSDYDVCPTIFLRKTARSLQKKRQILSATDRCRAKPGRNRKSAAQRNRNQRGQMRDTRESPNGARERFGQIYAACENFSGSHCSAAEPQPKANGDAGHKKPDAG